MSTLLTLMRKDLRLFFRDRVALALALLLPILLASVMGSAMASMMGGGGGGGGGGMPKVTLLVQDEDQSPASAILIGKLQAADGLRVKLVEDARVQVRNGDAPAALVIPAEYGEQLGLGQIPTTRLLRDPSASISQQVISGHLLFALGSAQLEQGGSALMRSGIRQLGFPSAGLEQADALLQSTWDSFDQLMEELPGTGGESTTVQGKAAEQAGASVGFDFLSQGPEMLGVEVQDVAGDEDEGPSDSAGVSHAFASMAVMMLMFNLVAAGGGLLDEELSGNLERLRLSPAGGFALLFAKLGFIVVVGLMQLAVLFLFGWVAFDVPVPSHALQLIAVSVCLCLAVAAMGMVFATACRSRKQMEGISTVVILVMSAMGGAWFPREITPAWFRAMGDLTVTAWAMDAYHGVLWYGKGIFPHGDLGGIGSKLLVLLGFAAVFTIISMVLFRRRFDSRS